MKLVALSGGIASGKSTVARRFAELGAHHIDADQLAREAVEPGSAGFRQIAERFGDAVIADDGSLDRAALGALVFGDSEALTALNSIVHPEVRMIAARQFADIERQDPSAVVIYDVPLLVEAGVQMPWDLVVITEAPESVRVRRMVELRGMSEADAVQRIKAQATDEERRAIADVVIDTAGSMAHTIDQIDAVWRRVSG